MATEKALKAQKEGSVKWQMQERIRMAEESMLYWKNKYEDSEYRRSMLEIRLKTTLKQLENERNARGRT